MGSKKIVSLILTAMIFICLYFISSSLLNNVYLFEWTARRKYCGLWVISFWMILCNKERISFLITIGNIVGIVCGQIMGDLYRNYNISTITSEMDAETVYRLHHHPGVEIWIFFIIIFAVAGIFYQKIISEKE